jgi:TfoX/Sxy family transcriptional regulator of competence genes
MQGRVKREVKRPVSCRLVEHGHHHHWETVHSNRRTPQIVLF